MTDFAAVDQYIEERLPSWTEELAEFCRFRSDAG